MPEKSASSLSALIANPWLKTLLGAAVFVIAFYFGVQALKTAVDANTKATVANTVSLDNLESKLAIALVVLKKEHPETMEMFGELMPAKEKEE